MGGGVDVRRRIDDLLRLIGNDEGCSGPLLKLLDFGSVVCAAAPGLLAFAVAVFVAPLLLAFSNH